ncbi:hypothetical protein BSKO_12697 [Bryopsis sp. KO-2023]|nr:hypothetical protein BSKO_12697 [Bryopsis sp. KO-2023]
MRRSAPQEPIPLSIRVDFEPRRNLLGKTETQDEFSDFVLPEGAQLILKRKSQCSDGIPMTMRPLAALWCEGTKRMSQCMGVDLHTPFFIGRGCRGSECVTDLVPGPSNCLLETLGVNIADANPTLEASCGIPPEDALWLEPSPKIASGQFSTSNENRVSTEEKIIELI